MAYRVIKKEEVRITSKISKKLKELRTEHGYTQKYVADMLGIDRSTYSYYESGRISPDIHTVLKVAKLLDVDYTEIMDSENVDVCADFEERFCKSVDTNTKFSPEIDNLNEEERALILSIRMLPKRSREEFIRSTIDSVREVRREDRFRRRTLI